MHKLIPAAVVAAAVLSTAAAPARAADKPAPLALASCPASLGTVAVVDGDTQGWTKYGLGSPRELIAAMVAKSGCFTLHNPASGVPADFLINAIAGDKEEVDQGVNLAKSAIANGAVYSGAVGGLARAVPIPMLGGALSMFGGLGGKKKTYAAGLRVLSPATGQTLAAGSGEAKRTAITFGQPSYDWYGNLQGTPAGAYASSKDGQMLSTAFIQAFNAVVAQAPALQAAHASRPPAPAPVAAAAVATYTTAVETKLWDGPAKAKEVRMLRAATQLTPTGQRDGLFVEVKDQYGTQGWVSVEDLK
jgi:hypothetical protein